jgi:glucose-1-phosphate thymidylyltransferase
VPVANKPVLFYGLEALRDAGIREVGIVVSDPREMLQPDSRTGERNTVMVNSQAEIRQAVGDGSAFGLEVAYIEQEAPLGLAHAVKISEDFMGGEPFVMYLGDNLIKDGITPFVREFEAEQPDAQILLAT